ncbi:MAG: hydroxymethylbilane synthase [SAR202 cluster bacterium]|nr:hydroxymethylbilane synthase [Chloroflexota bacterium]MQG87789.1 hydroxymethylbilane synthase [SAR202 cluster bacterium]|tara:strand:+ start:3585 stop:4520 length:936 start_codon:yes stop_codon:yes gene_type:complete
MTQTIRVIKVGTRGSDLALKQTAQVVTALRELNPTVKFEVNVVKTTGDIKRRENIETLGVGVFVRELESALIDSRIDIAVHSLKDMPAALPIDFKLAAVPIREDPRDAIISKSGESLNDLQAGSIIATGSARRKALIKLARPDLEVVPIRGNVPTRLEKLNEHNGPDAVMLAAAGLNRLGISDKISAYLPCMEFVAAVGQGALALEIRTSDSQTFDIANKLNDYNSYKAVSCERAFLEIVGGGCSAPIAAHAEITGNKIELSGFASTPDGTESIRKRVSGDTKDSISLGRQLGEFFVNKGTRKLIKGKSGN